MQQYQFWHHSGIKATLKPCAEAHAGAPIDQNRVRRSDHEKISNIKLF